MPQMHGTNDEILPAAENILLALYRDVKNRGSQNNRERPLAELAWLVFGQL